MKDASRILYKIGNIINIIGIVAGAILAIIFFVGFGAIDANTAAELGKTLKEAQTLYLTWGIAMTVCVVIWIVVLCLARKAIKALNDNSNSITSHVIMIVVGVIGSSIFYLLGGIFGVIAENQQK